VTNTYAAISERAKALHGEDVFEADFTAIEEKDQLDAGHLRIAPRTYRVLSNNFSAAPQGKTFVAALLVEQEAALIQGGHIERVVEPAKKKG
jgi:hypothetical protein